MAASASPGWVELPGVSRQPSPNFNARPANTDIDLLVIHHISLPPGQFGTGCATRLFLNQLDFDSHPWFNALRGLKVSSHFLIERDGQVTQFVSCEDRAWHAGVSRFEDRVGCNDFSIGIELEGTDDIPFADAQYERLAMLTSHLRERYPLSHVRGHNDIAPGRKTDPGRYFDWHRYAREAGWQPGELPPRVNIMRP